MAYFFTQNNNRLLLTGTSYEIGYSHGDLLKDKVHNSLETYEKLFKETSGFTWKEAREKALLHTPSIEKYNLNYMEEMEGLANGAGVQFEDILILNTRSEIALANSPDGCTSFALTKPKTDKVWLGQNWDWRSEQLSSLVHIKMKQKNLPDIEMVTEAGIIGKIGCNNASIGVCLNALVTKTWQPKVPIHLGLRAVLESSTFEEAVASVNHNQMASPAHFLIASQTDQAVSMEVSPVHTEKIFSKKGVLAHTNHLCSMKMKRKINEDPVQDSYSRLDEMLKQLEELNSDSVETDELFDLLSNHENYPDSICSHASDRKLDSSLPGMETVFSIIMNLTDKQLIWIEGKPCKAIAE